MTPFLLNLSLLSPLILGLLLSQILKFGLKAFQGIYLFLVAGNVLLSYFLLNGSWLPPLLGGLAGFLLVVLATGFLGNRTTPSDYAFFQFGSGLFPWTLYGLSANVIFAVLLILMAVLVALRPKFKSPFHRSGR